MPEPSLYSFGDIVFHKRLSLDSPIKLVSAIRHLEGAVDHQLYRETIAEMERQNVDREYIQGWIGGFMRNPKREEQRITEAYEKGYEDGENQNTTNYKNWIAG